MRITPAENPPNHYRPSIDGLRAVAVLSVLIFHLHPAHLPGGFLGVDIFFVISGYLITGIIVREKLLDSFSYANFYARRIKRIFPALFVVLLLCALVGVTLLTPETYLNFIKSSRYASAQLANFFFSRKVRYFEEGFAGQPLLHTWSLGVEEQFYLFWPIFIVGCITLLMGFRPFAKSSAESRTQHGSAMEEQQFRFKENIEKNIWLIFLLLAIISFSWCSILSKTNSNLAFYMFYTRAWEFCLGALVSLRVIPEPKKIRTVNILELTGFLLVAGSVMLVAEEWQSISFLRFGVVLPCLGTAILLHSSGRNGIITSFLSNQFPVFIGKISYSLYLYHWPMIIFYKICTGTQEVSIGSSLAILFISFFLSVVSYLFVERPARRTTLSDRTIIAIGVAASIVCVVAFRNMEQFDEASWRTTRYVNGQTAPPDRIPPQCSEHVRDGVLYYDCKTAEKPDAPMVALVGDSHSPHYLKAVAAWAGKNGYDVRHLGVEGCPMLVGDIRIDSRIDDRHNEMCGRALAFFSNDIVDDPNIRLIFLAQRFDLFYDGKGYLNQNPVFFFKDRDGDHIVDHIAYYQNQLISTVDRMREKGKDLIILEQVPILGNINDCDWEPLYKKVFSLARKCAYDYGFIEKWQRPSMDFINAFATAHHIPVFDPSPFLKGPLDNGISLYQNNDHLNSYGFQFLVPYFVREMDGIMAGPRLQHSGLLNISGQQEQFVAHP